MQVDTCNVGIFNLKLDIITLIGLDRKKFMKDVLTAEADPRMCWVSKDQKFHTKNEFGSLQR